jgi:hypothetical protein
MIAKAVFTCINTAYKVSLDRLFLNDAANLLCVAAADIAKSGAM